MNHLKEKFLPSTQRIVDLLIISTCWVIAYTIRFKYISGAQSGLLWDFTKITPFLVILTIYSLQKQGLYNSLRFSSRYKEVFCVLKGNFIGLVSFVILIYFFNEERLSRLTLIIYFLISSATLASIRIIIRNLLRSMRAKGYNLRHVLLIGNSKTIIDYIKTIQHHKDSGIRFMGWIDSDGLTRELEIDEVTQSYDEYKCLKTPDSIIIAYSGEKSHKAFEFIATHYNDVVPIQLLPDLSYSMVGHQIEDFGGIPLLSVNQPSFNSVELFAKRAFDILAVGLGGLLISPILLLLTLGVKLSSPGPILFGQRRVGLNGNEFTMWKFRSMRVSNNNDDSKEWSNKDNPRKTKFGSFIRATSLDELPQLLNVLLGQMSLVGPRPEQPYFVDKFRHEIRGYMLKHKMKPGITGWAQVNGWRGDTDLTKRIECDIYYIKHWSFWFDIKILFLTLFKGFINKNAY